MPWSHLPNLNLYYERGGRGVPVVFVHGGFASLATRLADFTDSAWTEHSWEMDFARRFDFVWYERRGCWRSDAPETGYDPVTQAQDLADLLDALRIPSAHAIGSSAGGPITMAFAALHPQRARSIVLAGTALQLFPPEDPATQTIRAVGGVLAAQGPEAAFDARPEAVEATYDTLWAHIEAAARGRLAEYLERASILDERARLLSRAERVRAHAIELRNMLAYIESDMREYAARVRCPALVLHGTDDRSVPLPLGEQLARTIPGASLRALEGEGHSVVHRSETGRQLAIDWIARQE